MHDGAYRFIARAAAALSGGDGLDILEIGAYNVNGSPRGLFDAAASYHGIDTRPGPGVDETANGATFAGGPYDVVVCAETLEHAAKPAAIVANAQSLLKPGGLLILTAATPERAPHGIDGGPLAEGERYAGIAPDDLRAWLDGWTDVQIVHDPAAGDVYATARAPKRRSKAE